MKETQINNDRLYDILREQMAQVIRSFGFIRSTSAVLPDKEKNTELAQMQGVRIEKSRDPSKYSVFDIADWFLKKAEKAEIADMTNKKLQKLCYYAQAWCYALKKYQLEGTDFEAWEHGPVSPALWGKYKSFGFGPITSENNSNPQIDDEDIKLLEDVWDTYGHITGNALEALTHRELPWMEARSGCEPYERSTTKISPKTMISFYNSIYQRD